MSTSKPGSPDQSNNAKTNQAWGGRFNEPVDDFVARFTASVSFDQRLYLTPVREDTNAKILRLKSQAYFAAAFLTAAVASVVAFLTIADASSEAFLPAAIINSTVSS